jgi:hypothetical protein
LPGTGANKVDVCWDSDDRALADSASETLDLRDGTLTDRLGQSVTMDILRGLAIRNNGTDSSLLVGGAAATQLGLFSGADDVLRIPPGGVFLFTSPDATGLDLTTNAHLKIADSGEGAAGTTYDIVLVGED